MPRTILNKTRTIILALILSAVLLFGFTLWFLNQKPAGDSNNNSYNPTSQIPSIQNTCLADDERADYLQDGEFVPKLPLTIIVRDKNTNVEKFRFMVDNLPPKHIHSIELYKCGVYANRVFSSGRELWHYDYSGKGKKILLFTDYQNIAVSFNDNFRIDNTETYVALIRSWVGDENHALVIKDLKTMGDAYVVTLKELVEKYGIEPGTIQLSNWYENMFQFEIIFPSERNPWFRLYSDTWKLEKTETLDEMLEEENL